MIGTSTVEKQLIELENTARSSIEKEAFSILSGSKEYRIRLCATFDESGNAVHCLELTLYQSYFDDDKSASSAELFKKLLSDLTSMRYAFEHRDKGIIVGILRIDRFNADAEYRALRFALSFYIKRVANRDEVGGGSGCTH